MEDNLLYSHNNDFVVRKSQIPYNHQEIRRNLSKKWLKAYPVVLMPIMYFPASVIFVIFAIFVIATSFRRLSYLITSQSDYWEIAVSFIFFIGSLLGSLYLVIVFVGGLLLTLAEVKKVLQSKPVNTLYDKLTTKPKTSLGEIKSIKGRKSRHIHYEFSYGNIRKRGVYTTFQDHSLKVGDKLVVLYIDDVNGISVLL